MVLAEAAVQLLAERIQVVHEPVWEAQVQQHVLQRVQLLMLAVEVVVLIIILVVLEVAEQVVVDLEAANLGME
jgi:hypothetical protein